MDTLKLLALMVLAVCGIAYFTERMPWKIKRESSSWDMDKVRDTRKALRGIEAGSKDCIIFYGSQTGTAEDFASRLAKEGSERFGFRVMVTDLQDYDHEELRNLPTSVFVFFILATYGEGEPTDNAVCFYDTITDFSTDDTPLPSLKYAGFGLGNDTYEKYNAMIRNVDAALAKRGAVRIGEIGEGNDGAGTMEDDFLMWKQETWAAIASAFNLKESKAIYKPTFSVIESPCSLGIDVSLGEPLQKSLEHAQKSPFSVHNPYIATVTESRELFNVEDRNCLHLEIAIEGSGLKYETGDHVAIWSANAGKEVDRLLQVFGLEEKRNNVINIKSFDASTNTRMPSRTTYDATFRYYLEICAPVSRQFLSTLATFAPDETTKIELARLGSDKDYFREKITKERFNIGQALQNITPKTFSGVPFSLLLEAISRMQPRYYSISSSALVQPNRISITAVVESCPIPGTLRTFKGVTTNYLLALKRAQNRDSTPDELNYSLSGPRSRYAGFKIPIHIRHSKFRLPSDISRPIVMVGPGTGVAPFRGFIQERAALHVQGKSVGLCVLFYGCRNRFEDFVYSDEWKKLERQLGDKLRVITAFSRETTQKVYVQHKLYETASLIADLLDQNANIYVCGDAANMAREVGFALGKIIVNRQGLSSEDTKAIVTQLKSSGRYQEDVWWYT